MRVSEKKQPCTHAKHTMLKGSNIITRMCDNGTCSGRWIVLLPSFLCLAKRIICSVFQLPLFDLHSLPFDLMSLSVRMAHKCHISKCLWAFLLFPLSFTWKCKHTFCHYTHCSILSTQYYLRLTYLNNVYTRQNYQKALAFTYHFVFNPVYLGVMGRRFTVQHFTCKHFVRRILGLIYLKNKHERKLWLYSVS